MRFPNFICGLFVTFFFVAGFAGKSLADAPAPPDPSLVYAWYKGDSGISVGSDGYAVTNWANSGTLGTTPSMRDLDHVDGAPYRWNVVMSDGTPSYVMRFHGGAEGIFAASSNFGSITGSRTIIVYAKVRQMPSTQGFLFDCSTFNNGLTRAEVNGGYWQIGTTPTGGPENAAGTNTAPVTLNTWQVHTFILTAGGSPTFQHYINGVQVGGTVQLSQSAQLSGLILGNSVAPGNQHGLQVDIAEALAYDSALTPSSREAVENYLTAKWGGVTDGVNNPPTPITSTSQPFVNGTGYPGYRIPALVTSDLGTVIVSADGRYGGDIPSKLDNVVRRSTDNGETWGPMIVTANYGSDPSDTDTYPIIGNNTPQNRTSAGDPALLVDRTNGRIWDFYDNGSNDSYHGFGRVIKLEMRYSDDDGQTWSARKDIEAENPALRPTPTETFTYSGNTYTYGYGEYIVGPGSGIQLTVGPHAGRLIFPVYWYRTNNNSSCIYSDDHGQTWQRGGVCGYGTGEVQMVQLTNGDLLATMRPSGAAGGYRWFSKSSDGGITWGAMFRFDGSSTYPVPDPGCQGSIIRISTTQDSNANRIVFANPNSSSGRSNMTVRISYDEGASWSASRVVYSGGSAYSALTKLANGDIGLLYEKNGPTSIDFVDISVPQASSGTDSLPTYVNWANTNFTIPELADPTVSAPVATPNNDSVPNLLKFAANTTPFSPPPVQAPVLDSSDGNFTFTYRKNDAATDLSYIVQQSTDLKKWAPVTMPPITVSDDGHTSLMQISVPANAESTLMFRLQVTGD